MEIKTVITNYPEILLIDDKAIHYVSDEIKVEPFGDYQKVTLTIIAKEFIDKSKIHSSYKFSDRHSDIDNQSLVEKYSGYYDPNLGKFVHANQFE
ncbi:TPA: hypothetical protein ACGO1T_001055 [Streptococcus suis]